MKHITTAEKSLLMGDEAAELLVRYAALLGRHGSADSVKLQAYGTDGDPVEVHFLLNSGTVLLTESSHATFAEPDNSDGVRYLRERMRMLESPPNVQPMEPPSDAASEWED